ncbi:623_t:CDS:2, partial [Gigaspora margarita]
QKKVLAMSQIQSDILWFHKIKLSKKYDSQVCKLHVVVPISSGDKGTEQELVNSDLEYQVSNNSYYIEEDKTTRRQMKIEFGKHEHQFENKDDEILLSSKWDSDFSLEE